MKKKGKKKRERNFMFTTFFIPLSQQIFSGMLLLTVIGGQKSNFNDEFKLERVTS